MDSKVVDTARMLNNLTSITARVYRDGKRISYFPEGGELPEAIDLFRPYMKDMNRMRSPVGCVTTPHDYLFGFIIEKNEILVLGPVKEGTTPRSDLEKIALRIESSGEHKKEIIRSIRNCPKLSYSAFLPLIAQAYSLLHFDASKDDVLGARSALLYDMMFYTGPSNDLKISNKSIETEFENLIETGDIKGLKNWYNLGPRFHYFTDITGDRLQDVKYCFTIATTLYAKAAAKGGLERGYTIKLLLDTVRAAAGLENIDEIHQLQSDFAMKLASDVAENNKNHSSRLVKQVAQIIERDLFKTIKVNDIADELGVSRVYLSERFHSETGYTIKEYITIMKMREAKDLLRNTDRSIISISTLLGFSSQSHFNRKFKENTGMTPHKFRESI